LKNIAVQTTLDPIDLHWMGKYCIPLEVDLAQNKKSMHWLYSELNLFIYYTLQV